MPRPFSFTLWSQKPETFSITSGFDTPLKSQSMTRTSSIGALLKPLRYKAYWALRAFRLRTSRFRTTGTKFPASPSSVEEVDGECRRRHLADVDVSRIDVLDEAAAHGVVLNAHSDIQGGAVHSAIFRENVAHAAGNFASDSHTTVAIFHPAIADDNVLRGNPQSTAVGVSARLDGDAIVPGVEETILNQHIGRGFRIASVRIRSKTADGESSYRDICT